LLHRQFKADWVGEVWERLAKLNTKTQLSGSALCLYSCEEREEVSD